MKRKLFMTLGLTCLLSIGLVSLIDTGKDATNASITDVEYTKDFSTGLDEKWQKINDTDGHYFTQGSPSSISISGFNYNIGSLTSANMNIPAGKSQVLEFSMDYHKQTGGYICFSPLTESYGAAWGNMVYFAGEATPGIPGGILHTTGAVPVEGIEPHFDWYTFDNVLRLRNVFNSDGSFAMYGFNVGVNRWDPLSLPSDSKGCKAGTFNFTTFGHLWIAGNSQTGTTIFSGIKFGYSDSTEAAISGNVEWLLDSTSHIGNLITYNDDELKRCSCTITEGKTNLGYNKPNNLSGIIYNSLNVNSSTAGAGGVVATSTLSITPTSAAANKVAGLAVGVDFTKSTLNTGYNAGFYIDSSSKVMAGFFNNETGFPEQGTLKDTGLLANNVVNDPILITVKVYADRLTLDLNVGSAGTITLYTTIKGYFGFGAFDIDPLGDAAGIINSFSLTGKVEVIKSGRHLDLGFDYPDDLTAFNLNASPAFTYEVNNSKLTLTNPLTGSYFNTKGDYSNFTITADIVCPALDKFCWVGFVVGSNTPYDHSNNSFLANTLVYLQTDKVCLLEKGTRDERFDHNITFTPGSHVYFKIQNVNNTLNCYVSLSSDFSNAYQKAFTVGKSDGYIALTCTEGCYWSLDNLSIVNDDVTVISPTITTAISSYNCAAQEKIDGTLSASSGYGTYPCHFGLVDDGGISADGTLSISSSGTFSFTANSIIAKSNKYTITYFASDLGIKTQGTFTISLRSSEVEAIYVVLNDSTNPDRTLLRTEFYTGEAFSTFGLTVRGLENADQPDFYKAMAPDTFIVDSSNVDMSHAGIYEVIVSLKSDSTIFDSYTVSVVDPVAPKEYNPPFFPVDNFSYVHGTEENLNVEVDFKNQSLSRLITGDIELTNKEFAYDSAKIVLKSTFLETLDEGVHTFVLYTTSGAAKFNVEVSFGATDLTPNILTPIANYYKGSNSLLLAIDFKGQTLSNVTLDNQTVSSSLYILGDNSVSFLSTVLEGLNKGTHKGSVTTTAGTANFTIIVKENSVKPRPTDTNPPTLEKGEIVYRFNSQDVASNTVNLKGEELLYVVSNGNVLVNGLDYSFSSSTLTLLPHFLNQHKVNDNVTISLVSFGGTASFNVAFGEVVIDYTPTFDKSVLRIDESTLITVDTKGGEFKEIICEGYILTEGYDFTYNYLTGEITFTEKFIQYLDNGEHLVTVYTNLASGSFTLQVNY